MPIPQPRLSFASSAPNNAALDEYLTLQQNYGHHLNLQMPTITTEDHQRRVLSCSMLGNTLSFYDTQYLYNANQLYQGPSMLDSAHGSRIYMTLNHGTRHPPDAQSIVEVPSNSCSPTELHNSSMLSASYSAHDLGRNPIHWDTIDILGTLKPPVDRQPLVPVVDQRGRASYHQSSVHSSYYLFSEPSHPPPYQSPSPIPPRFGPHSMFSGSLETDSLPRHASRVRYQPPGSSSRRRRAARAIEYHGLLIDEEELRKGQVEPEGKLIVHQCRWEEDHSPCGLWTTGDKSSINVHIQKWHGGMPGGDKLQDVCRWSGCGQTMLKESITRHILTIHLEEMWKCQGCGKELVRNDAYGRHVAKSEFPACQTSGALITYSDDAREIDVRAALESGA